MKSQTQAVIMATLSITVLLSICHSTVSSSSRNYGVSKTKPGKCPLSDPLTAVDCKQEVNSCSSDCECSGQKKCCYLEGCGYSCQDPTGVTKPEHTCGEKIISTKPGICLKPNPTMECIWCNDSCTSDCECEGKAKCCPSNCGNGCQ